MTDMIEEARKPGRPAKVVEQEKEIVAKGTKPGWKPSSLLGTLKARSGFTARWVSNDPSKIAKMRSEGWLVMKPKDNVGPYEQDGEHATEIRYRDMIGMMLSDDQKESRTEYYRNETRDATRTILKQSDAELSRKGVSTYTPKGMPGRIVIE